jgi:hypothetical protein
LVLEVALSLQGHEYDLLAYIDGLLHENTTTDNIVMPMRCVTDTGKEKHQSGGTTYIVKQI